MAMPLSRNHFAIVKTALVDVRQSQALEFNVRGRTEYRVRQEVLIMWPCSDAFSRALRKHARRLQVRRQPPESAEDRTMSSIDMDFAGFYNIRPRKLGELCALIFAQAQADGGTRVKLHYGINKMIYTLGDVDYEMVPLSPPSNVDLVRAIVRTSRTTWDNSGSLPVRFADLDLALKVDHQTDIDDPHLGLTGFTGEPWLCSNESHAQTPPTPSDNPV